jgi:excisionase family DNA binding protein
MSKPVAVDKLLYTPLEAAHALGVGRSTIYVLMANGKYPRCALARPGASQPRA